MPDPECSEYDVAVCGGGMAGLTLALQLSLQQPARSVIVLERQTRPLPEACHKVGESTVEIGAHYLGELLGLDDYLRAQHLVKNGLRYFVGDARGPVHARTEIGPPELPKIPAYQLDRGRFEQHLRERVEAGGVALREGAVVREVRLAETDNDPSARHEIEYERDGARARVRCRWLIDASGRRGLLHRKLGLRRPSPHAASAAWFRVRARVDIKDFVAEEHEEWHARDREHIRYLSTVHMLGAGYWVWIIPLASGYTSLGIVTDERALPLREYSRPAAARAWLAEHEPRVAEQLASREFEDFHALRDYSYLSSQVFSARRWACVGEAALFVDPFYSPGADFLAMSNCYAAQLIAEDFAGALDRGRVEAMNRFFVESAHTFVLIYADKYRLFGRPRVAAAKIYWDNLVYWGFIAQHFFQGLYTRADGFDAEIHEIADSFRALHRHVQGLLELWASYSAATWERPAVVLPQIPSYLASLHRDLGEHKDRARTLADMRGVLREAREVGREIFLRALHEAGPERAALLRAVEYDRWGPPIDHERFDAARCASRRARLKTLPPSGREFERCFGRVRFELAAPPMTRLLELAGVVAAGARASGRGDAA
ncbi:MAG: NAD(P)/FAD-dependent oxidoreductase [Myxococcales bacterium]|nr:NAD(P)/FAD-dependent oxidoreductase [Myxococcales bacterium]